jgi:hypothetical protein
MENQSNIATRNESFKTAYLPFLHGVSNYERVHVYECLAWIPTDTWLD